MNIKSLALAAAMLALAPAVTAPMLGGYANAMTTPSPAGTPDASGNSEPGVQSATCVHRSYATQREAIERRNDRCPKTFSLKIGKLQII